MTQVNEELADQVWEAWEKGEINDLSACIAWVLIIEHLLHAQKLPLRW